MSPAIGHHKDSTLADNVADYAASTPTAVAHYLANLCLHKLPSAPATAARHSGLQVAASSARPSIESRNLPYGSDQPDSRELEPRDKEPSRISNALAITLLMLAFASVAFLVAVMILQLQS